MIRRKLISIEDSFCPRCLMVTEINKLSDDKQNIIFQCTECGVEIITQQDYKNEYRKALGLEVENGEEQQ